MKAVKFERKYPPYNSGEIAGFSDSVATKLEARGIATILKSKEVESVEEPKEPEKAPEEEPPKISEGSFKRRKK